MNLAEKDDRWQGTFFWYKTKKRQESFHYSDPIDTTIEVFFHLNKTSFNWETISDLEKYRIGDVASYTHGVEFENARAAGKLNVFTVVKDTQLLGMLLQDRIDVFPSSKQVGLMYVSQLPEQDQKKITFHPQPIKTSPVYLLISKRWDQALPFLHDFNQALSRM